MLFEGTRRDGFSPLRPEIKAKEPTVIATRATIRNAKSAGIPQQFKHSHHQARQLIRIKFRHAQPIAHDQPFAVRGALEVQWYSRNIGVLVINRKRP
jgi:hypothetical protein